MRRLVVSLVASCGLFVLAACSGGGYGFNGNGANTNTVEDIIAFLVGGTTLGSNGAGGVNDAFVSPTGSAPVSVTAVGIKGTGSGSVVLPDKVFVWSEQYVTGTYNKGATPGAPGTCGAIPAASGTITITGVGVLGATVSAIIAGVPVTYVETAGQSSVSIVSSLAAAINANSRLASLGVSASASANVVTITANPAAGGGSNFTLAATNDATGATATASGGTLNQGQGNAPLNNLLQQNIGAVVGNPYPGYGGAFVQLTAQPAIAPLTSPNYTQTTAQVYVGIPFFSATSFQQPSPPTTGNYCLRLIATDPQNGKVGTLIVVVSQSP